MKNKLVSLLLVLMSTPSFAAGVSSGTVDLVLINSSNFLMFSAGSRTGAPVCASGSNQWAVSLDTAKGKSMYALLLQAQAMGQTVFVTGTGDCADWPDRERPLYMYAQ